MNDFWQAIPLIDLTCSAMKLDFESLDPACWDRRCGCGDSESNWRQECILPARDPGYGRGWNRQHDSAVAAR